MLWWIIGGSITYVFIGGILAAVFNCDEPDSTMFCYVFWPGVFLYVGIIVIGTVGKKFGKFVLSKMKGK